LKLLSKSVEKFKFGYNQAKPCNTVQAILIEGRNIQTNVVEKIRTAIFPQMYGFRKSAFYKVIKKNTTKTDRPYMTYNNMAQKICDLHVG